MATAAPGGSGRFDVAARRYPDTPSSASMTDVAVLADGRLAIVAAQFPSPSTAPSLLEQARSAMGSGASAAEALPRTRSAPAGPVLPAVCAVVDADSGTVDWAGAGGSAALLLDAHGTRPVPGTQGVMPPGGVLVLHTAADGPGVALEPQPDAAAVADALGEALASDRAFALVVARLLPAPLQQRWLADPRTLPALRRALRDWGALAGLAEETVEDLQLLVCEAASNAVEHAYRGTEPGEVELSVAPAMEGGVRVTVRDFGRWRPPPADPGYRGRGLALIDTLGRDVELDAGSAGTCIAFTVTGTAPADPPSDRSPWWAAAVDEVSR